MIRKLLLIFLFPGIIYGQKQVYIPNEWKQPGGLDYSFSRSKQSANFIVFWGPLAGTDPTKAPSNIDFDPQNILNTAEDLYDFYIDSLKFLPDTGLLAKNKIILVMLNTWTNYDGWAYGGNYDGVVGAMWMHPDAASSGPTLAHEFTHTLQNYTWMMYPGHGFINNSYVGFIWETHAEFMALQKYKSVALEFDMARWLNTYQFHWGSTRHHYQAFVFLQFIKELDGLEMINRMWRESIIGEHPLETYKRLKGINQEQLDDLFGQYAMRNVSWDYEIGSLLRERVSTLNEVFVTHKTIEPEAIDTISGWYKIQEHLAPQDYGYNIIRLYPEEVKACGKRIVHLNFKGHVDPNAGSGWRYGFVALKNDSTARYSEIYKTDKEVAFIMEPDETELYLVVLGAPTEQHNYIWEAGFPKIYRYPYEFRIENVKPEGFQKDYRKPNPGIPGKLHSNGGGFVANTATVASTAYVGPKAQVLNNAKVQNNARIEDLAIIKNAAVINQNAVVSGTSIIGEVAQVTGNAKVRQQSRIYGNSVISGNAIIEGNTTLFNTQVYEQAKLSDNTFCWGANLHGDIKLGGDAEFFQECSNGTYFQFESAYDRNCDGLDNHPANLDINTPHPNFSNSEMDFNSTINCEGIAPKVSMDTVKICMGQYYYFNGDTLSQTGVYPSDFKNTAGNDSLVILHLYVGITSFTKIETSVCQGSSYQFNNQLLNLSGDYSANFKNQENCDSIILLHLEVTPIKSTSLDLEVCEDIIYDQNGNVITTPGLYQYFYTTSSGCDSMVNLSVSFPFSNAFIYQKNDTLLISETAVSYQWIDCSTGLEISGANKDFYIPEKSGSYKVILTSDSCSKAIPCFDIVISDTKSLIDDSDWSVYPNPTLEMCKVKLYKTLGKVIDIQLFDILGRKLVSDIIANDNDSKALNLEFLKPGVYTIRLTIDGLVSSSKSLIIE